MGWLRRKAPQKSTREVFSKGDETRANILSQAMRIASVEGLAALTIGRLAKELRTSKSGLFVHFRSNEGLELATVDRCQRSLYGQCAAP